MPKAAKEKQSKVIHPNSRKALQLARESHRSTKLERRHEEQNLKQLAKLKKLNWFQENLAEDRDVYNATDVKILIDRYLQRFDVQKQEQEQLKNIKGRKIHENMKQQFGHQFAIEKETQDFKTCGLEVPNLMKKSNLQVFRKWDGDIRFLPNIDIIMLSEKKLNALISKDEDERNTNEEICNNQNIT